MGRPDDVARLVKEGMTPLEIAESLNINIKSVEGYLHRAVGEGLLRRSDVYFSVPPEHRDNDNTLVHWYSNPQNALGDMYEDIRLIEINVHKVIRETLVQEFGADEAGWWRQGVPENVRVKCQERRERDSDEPCEAFCYLDLIDLDIILKHQWSLLKNLFPYYSVNRKALSSDLQRLNRIRNRVMHPVKGFIPGEEDFDFVRNLQRSLQCT